MITGAICAAGRTFICGRVTRRSNCHPEHHGRTSCVTSPSAVIFSFFRLRSAKRVLVQKILSRNCTTTQVAKPLRLALFHFNSLGILELQPPPAYWTR